jgi:cytochrome c-type biogenesis protein CcmH/NrfG
MGIPKKNSEEETRSQARVETRLKDQQIESQQQAWRWLLMGVIALVIVETFASGWLSRNRVR